MQSVLLIQENRNATTLFLLKTERLWIVQSVKTGVYPKQSHLNQQIFKLKFTDLNIKDYRWDMAANYWWEKNGERRTAASRLTGKESTAVPGSYLPQPLAQAVVFGARWRGQLAFSTQRFRQGKSELSRLFRKTKLIRLLLQKPCMINGSWFWICGCAWMLCPHF